MTVELPGGVERYRTTPIFTAETTPSGLLKTHRTKPGVWAVIQVEAGTLAFFLEGAATPRMLSAGDRLVCAPEAPHHVELSPDSAFHIEFWRASA